MNLIPSSNSSFYLSFFFYILRHFGSLLEWLDAGPLITTKLKKILENSEDEILSESDSEVEDDLNQDDVQSNTEDEFVDEVAAEVIDSTSEELHVRQK